MRWSFALALVLLAPAARAEALVAEPRPPPDPPEDLPVEADTSPITLGPVPQGNASLVVGGAAAGPGERFWDHGEVHLGLRGDCMFLREGARDFGLGPYGEIGTWAFNQLQLGAGVSFHLPVHRDLPLVVSAGGHARFADDDLGVVAPGAGGAVFWGFRGFDRHARYALAAGLLVDLRHSAPFSGGPGETMLTVAAQIDATLIAVPFVLLGGLIAGPTEEARDID
jgi:hypothetical protein